MMYSHTHPINAMVNAAHSKLCAGTQNGSVPNGVFASGMKRESCNEKDSRTHACGGDDHERSWNRESQHGGSPVRYFGCKNGDLGTVLHLVARACGADLMSRYG